MQEAADGGYPFRAGTRYINRVFPAASMIDIRLASWPRGGKMSGEAAGFIKIHIEVIDDLDKTV